MFLNSCHVFNFNCGFTHVSYIWPDTKFLNGSCCKAIGSTTIELSIILERYVKGLRVSLLKVVFTASSGLTI